MATKFSPSINVVRDQGEDFGYHLTPNATRVAAEIIDGEKTGIHSFQLIGSYGTGKSAFLVAFMNWLAGKNKHFGNQGKAKPPKVINLVGEYGSLIDFLAQEFEVKNDLSGNQRILDAIHERYEMAGRLFLIIDEFGKFLEYASKHDPEREMYFIQQLAEFVNKPERNITLIVSLHQSIEAYSSGINAAQRMEWRKVQGRLRELTFNEPIAQLIHLAASQLASNGAKVPKGVDLEAIAKLAKKHRLFEDHTETWKREELNQLYPLDIVSTHILTKGLQAYGQNERSLFTFLQAGGIKLRKGSDVFGLPQVFDHFNSEFYSFLRGAFNPHRRQWEMIWSALERVEAEFDKDRLPYMDLVKTIGLLQLFASQGAQLNDVFLSTYLKFISSEPKAEKHLAELSNRKVLLFVKHRSSYKLQEGTDLDFQSALLKASSEVDSIGDVVLKLAPYFRHKHVVAKEATYRTGAPRLFEYRLSHKPIKDVPKGEVDGFINLLFNSELSLEQVKKASKASEEAIVFGYFNNADMIKDTLLEIERTQRVIDQHTDDKVAVKELKNIRLHQEQLLDHYIHDALFSKNVQWIHQGKVRDKVKDARSFNRMLSEVVTATYPATPIYKNELINREKVSPAASTGRKKLFGLITEKWNEEDFGFAANEFPPERAIYATLLKENGIHREGTEGFDLFAPTKDNSFHAVWECCEQFLADSRHGRKDINELIERLGERPYKLKNGLIELWVPLFLFIKRGDYALYQNDQFVPQLTGPILYMMNRQPKEFQVKAFMVDGIRLKLFNRYKAFLGKEEVKHLTNGELIDVTKPFLTFYRSLNDYAQQTHKLSGEARDLRAAIKNATDPERTFFEDLPNAMRLSLEDMGRSDEQLGKFIGILSTAIDELQQALPQLVDRMDSFLGEEVLKTDTHFPHTQTSLVERLKAIKEHQLLAHLRPLFKRTMAPLDEREVWISSIAEGALGKPLSKFTDRDEDELKEKLRTMYGELLNLAEIHEVESDPKGAPALRMQITTTSKGTRVETIQYPAKKKAQVESLIKDLKGRLTSDASVTRAALAWLLNEELEKE